MSELESKLQSKVIRFCESLGAFVVKITLGNKTGLSDTIVCYRGRYLTIELKAEGKKPNELQYYKMRKVQEAGGIALWSDNLADLGTEIIKQFTAIDLEVAFLHRSGFKKETV